jgi:hypothetical protein
MVLPAKIFEIKEDTVPRDMLESMRGFRHEEPYELADGGEISLVTQILDLEQDETLISGVFSKDILREQYYRRRIVETPTTEEAPFWITPHGERSFLIVMAPSVARGVKKLLTNHVANSLSEILYGKVGFIVESRIPNDVLRDLHESNPQATNLIWFDDVDIPGVKKLCLAGEGLSDTNLYKEYLDHGKIWYVVFEAKKRGVTVGITRSCVVTLFSRSTVDEFVQLLSEDLLGLID